MKPNTPIALSAVLTVLAIIPGSIFANEPIASEASLQIQSARVSRTSNEFTKKFGGRYYGENNPGVSLQLQLTLNQATLLPIQPNDVTVSTFVDDTYQNLLIPDNGGGYYNGGYRQTLVSDDGHTALFSVTSTHSPAEQAGRVFVRGSLRARVCSGKTLKVGNRMTMMVGQEATMGDFHTVVQSVSAANQSYNGQHSSILSVTFTVDGDASRIQKIRIIGANGQVLNDDRQTHINVVPNPENRPTTISVILSSTPTEPVTIEYTFPEKVDLVSIPFEAQVDLGNTKVGPIRPFTDTPPKADSSRPWPPPNTAQNDTIPPRRPAFDPK